MTVDLAVILAHSLDNSNIVSLPHEWNSNRQISNALSRFYQFLTYEGQFPFVSDEEVWYWEHWQDAPGKKWEGINPEEIWNNATLQGPCLLSLHFGKMSLYFAAPLRLTTFI